MRARWVLAALLCGCAADPGAVPAVAAPAPAPLAAPEPPIAEQVVRQDSLDVRSGDALGSLLARAGFPDPNRLVRAFETVLPARHLRPGRAITLVHVGEDPVPAAFRYPLDDARVLVVWDGEPPRTSVHLVSFEERLIGRTLEVRSSLWEAAVAVGLTPLDILRLATIFEYEVDFNTEIQADARMILVGEGLYDQGAFQRLGDLHAVRLENAGKSWTALRRLDASGKEGWYKPDGTPLRRPFLRSPLAFSNVTSGFNPRRFHPVLKTRRPHNGVDFGAPTGTPVRAVADGKVTLAGTNGGYGRQVALDHEGPWTTSYSHLSKVAVKKGAAVRQGEVVGYVGQTGLATGPHLHYELRRDGKPLDPMKAALPTVEPLTPEELPELQALAQRWLPLLEGHGAGGEPVAELDRP